MEEWFVLSSIQPRFHSKLPMDADLAVAVFLIITGMTSRSQQTALVGQEVRRQTMTSL